MDKQHLIFQIDSDIVKNSYKNNPNYLIEYDESGNGKDCIIYFSSNNIYFPNDESTFTKRIIEKNSFEWYGARITSGVKHIFIRDIKKQWYLTGINDTISTPERLLDFLKKETLGYEVITLGSSAGGYAAVLYGSQLDAKRIYSFNGQMEIDSLLETSNKFTDPIVFEFSKNKNFNVFYDLIKFIKKPKNIYYFYSNKSQWDIQQYNHIKENSLNVISLNTSHHGIPFLKGNLKKILNLNDMQLYSLTKRKHNLFFFSIQLDGFFKTFQFAYIQILKKLIN
jgi:hypothetical protein